MPFSGGTDDLGVGVVGIGVGVTTCISMETIVSFPFGCPSCWEGASGVGVSLLPPASCLTASIAPCTASKKAFTSFGAAARYLMFNERFFTAFAVCMKFNPADDAISLT